MAIWLVRGGAKGEFENRFLDDGRVYLTWERSKHDLSLIKSKSEISDQLMEDYPEAKKGTIRNWTGQIFPFIHEMKVGDWVILPSKLKSSIFVGEIKSGYSYDPKADYPYYHSRKVDWFAKDIPRSNFDQDILYTLGAFLTVCKISRNNAESRIRAMYKSNWQPVKQYPGTTESSSDPEVNQMIDIEVTAKDQIARWIIQKFKGHGMAILVEEVLKAKGYVTYRSPEGPDKGVDILAAPEPFGFGKPRLCVQVKSGDTPIDRPTLDQLLGAMQNFKADQGLLVSWAGFKTTVDKEIPSQFFSIRLWDQSSFIKELLSVYDKLSEDLKAELPLKRIWSLNLSEDELME